MNHLKWMGHETTVLDIQRKLRNDTDSCEVVLIGKGHSVRAHRFVLSSCSDLMRNILVDVPVGQEATIIVPDIKGSLLESVLSFIYIGETSLTSSNLSEFLEAINVLGIKSAISFECSAPTFACVESAALPTIKSLEGLQIAQEELIEADAQAIETTVLGDAAATARDLEFLDVYNTEAQPKITYSIEHINSGNGTEFILTENSNTFAIQQNAKLESVEGSSETDKMVEVALQEEEDEEGEDEEEEEEEEEDMDSVDAQIIEEFSNTADAVIDANNAPSVDANDAKSKIKTYRVRSSKLASVDTCLTSNLKTDADFASYNASQSTHEYNLELAVQAVIGEGVSLQKAAQRYDLSKTVLWRRVRKHPDYMKNTRENPVFALAYERLKMGQSLKTISLELDIPMSTLHRHKVRLAEQGRLPKYITLRKRDAVSKDELREKLAKAVHACVNGGMSQNHAANLFDIPKSTLWRHLQRRVSEGQLTQTMKTDNIKEEIILS